MHGTQLHAWEIRRAAAAADDHRNRHRAEVIDLFAERRRARLRVLLARLGRAGGTPQASRRPTQDPCSDTPKAAA
jgi:hypothetical protein